MHIGQGGSQVECLARNLRLAPALAVSLPVCRRVPIREIIDRFCPMDNKRYVTHGQVAEFVILHLLQSAQRLPLYHLQHWAEQYHLNLLYACPPEAFNDDRIGRALDALSHAIGDIEAAVVTQALEQFNIDVSTIHWDLTNVTFCGAHEDSDLIGPGYGGGAMHQHQLKVSLHASSQGGIPLRHQILPGGAHQAPLAPAMLQDLQQRLGRSDLIVVSDRAGISYDNIVAYRRAKAHCVGPLQATNAEKQQLAAVPQEAFHELAYRSQHAPQERYSCYDTTLEMRRQKRKQPISVRALFIHSTRKQQQDAEDRQKRLDQVIDKLTQLQRQLNQRRFAHADYVRGQIEKTVPKALYEIVRYELTGSDGQLALRFGIDEQALGAAAQSDGRYILIADLPEASADEAFELFKRQASIERRFRNLKSDLSVHPLWLQHEHRIHALLLLFVLALVVFTLLELCSERAGLSTERYHKMTARELIWRFAVVDLVEIRIRGQPTQYQLTLSTEQQYLLGELNFPDLTAYLKLT